MRPDKQTAATQRNQPTRAYVYVVLNPSIRGSFGTEKLTLWYLGSFLFRVDVNPAAIPAIYLVDLFEASQAEFMIGQCSSQILYIYDESSRVNNGMFKTREASCNEYAPQKSDPSRALGQMT